MKTYRVDFLPEGESRPTVIRDASRTEAMRLAASRSRTHGTAYAIASDDGRDTGQRVYCEGRFSHEDDAY